MRLRKRHAWSAALIALFVLPVVKPEGFPALEGRVDGILGWTGRFDVGNPHAWRVTERTEVGEGDAHAKALEEIAISARQDLYLVLDDVAQRGQLRDAFQGLDRLPRAVTCRIVRAHDPSSTRRSLLIDRGSEDGLEVGHAVVQGRVLVGLVQRVGAHDARVQLVTDPYSRVPVALRSEEGVRSTGWLRGGSDPDRMPLRNLRAAEGLHVRVGDAVVTGNEDERIPAGLVVGRVVESSDADLDAHLEVRIRPLLDLDRSETVLVLLPAR